jgi:methyl-accepting chemotaxis protein
VEGIPSLSQTISFRQRLASLRVRLLLASAVALLGLTSVAGVTLHQVFENQARDHLAERAKILAAGAAAFLSVPEGSVRQTGSDSNAGAKPSTDSDFKGAEANRLSSLIAWLKTDPDFESIRLLDEEGSILLTFLAPGAESPELPSFSAAAPASRGTSALQVEISLSPARLARELNNIRWLSASIALLAGAFFAALSIYLTRGVVLPLEQIRRAARRIASGETNVRIPFSGDWELDEFAHSIESVAERRTGSVAARPQ